MYTVITGTGGETRLHRAALLLLLLAPLMMLAPLRPFLRPMNMLGPCLGETFT
jgi:hypothetical protein